MLGPKAVIFISLSALVLSSIAACNVKDEKKSTDLSYQYNVNGCDTGKKTFASLSSYCEALKNDELNNFCAAEMRFEEFKAKCGGGSQAQKKSPSRPQENPPSTGAETVRPSRPPVPGSEALPEEIQISAHFEKPTKVSPKDAGEKLLVSLDGKAIVDSIGPHVKRSLRLDRAEEVVLADLESGKCDLSLNQYRPESDNRTISFALIGVDEKDQLDGAGCLAYLSTISMNGFVVKFKNVPVGGVLSQDVISRVILKIENKE